MFYEVGFLLGIVEWIYDYSLCCLIIDNNFLISI